MSTRPSIGAPYSRQHHQHLSPTAQADFRPQRGRLHATTPQTSYILPNHRNLAFRSRYTDNVYFAFRQLIMALLGHDVMRSKRQGGGNGNGRNGNGRNGNGGGFYKEIIDILLMRKCIPCVRACLQQMRINIDRKLVVKYTQTLFHTIDTAFKTHHGITLSQYIHQHLSRTKMGPAFDLISKYDPSSSMEMRSCKYLFTMLIADILPSRTQLKNTAIYSSIQPELLKFIARGKGDVSMIAGASVGYILKAYEVEGFSMPSVPCLVCTAFNKKCQNTK